MVVEEDGDNDGGGDDDDVQHLVEHQQDVEIECKTIEPVVIWRPVVDQHHHLTQLSSGKMLQPTSADAIVQLEGTTIHDDQQWTTVAVEYVDGVTETVTTKVDDGTPMAVTVADAAPAPPPSATCEETTTTSTTSTAIVCGGKFECGCGRKYNTEASYRYHLYECGREPSFQCPYCMYKGKRNTTLNKHIRAKHLT